MSKDFKSSVTEQEVDEFNKKMIFQTDDFAKMSKDKSTKVGALLLKENQYHPEAWGYNGMVRGANDDLLVRHERPEKYLWTEHAERNLYFNEARKIIKGHIVFCSQFPSIIEARAIAATGLSRVVTVLPEGYTDEYDRWVNKPDVHKLDVSDEIKNFARVNQMFNENGIRIIYPLIAIDESNTPGINLTKDDLGKMNKYRDYMEIVQNYANRWSSPFIAKKSAALILESEGYTPVAWGVYDLPVRFKAVASKEERVNELYYIPAVCNAIYTTIKPILQNSTLFASWCPCIDCSMAASEVGTTKIVSKKPDFTNPNDLRWKESFENSLKFYERIGMNTKFYSYRELDETLSRME